MQILNCLFKRKSLLSWSFKFIQYYTQGVYWSLVSEKTNSSENIPKISRGTWFGVYFYGIIQLHHIHHLQEVHHTYMSLCFRPYSTCVCWTHSQQRKTRKQSLNWRLNCTWTSVPFYSAAQLGAFDAMVKQMLEDVQERLVYRTHIYIQTDITGYNPAPGDLAYPEKLEMMEVQYVSYPSS